MTKSKSWETITPQNWRRNKYSPEERRNTALKKLLLADPAIDGDEELLPGYDCAADGTIENWKSDTITQPTEAAIAAKVAEFKAIYDSEVYAHNRADEYPDLGMQLDKIYDDGIAKWKTEMVDPIKAKWPKDNSGPIE